MSQELVLIGGIIILAVSLLTRSLYPPLVLFIFMFIAPEETLGTGYAFIDILGRDYIVQLFRAALMISAVVSIYKLLTQRASPDYSPKLVMLGVMLSFCAAWILISNSFAIKEHSGSFLSRYLLINGPCASIITLAYYRDKFARNLFVALILMQIILSVSVIKFPDSPLRIFLSPNYSEYAQELELGAEVIGSRVAGQFQNAVQLSYYSAVAIIIGLFLLSGYKRINKIVVGSVFLVLGIWAQVVTVTRAVMMGLVFGFAFASFNARKGLSRFISIICLGVMGVIFLMFAYPEAMDAVLEKTRFINISDEFSGDSYRLLAIELGIKAIAMRPVFGYGSLNILDEYFPYVSHAEPLRLAMGYGLPVGLCSLVLISFGMLEDIKNKLSEFREKSNMKRSDANMLRAHTMAVWVTVFMVLTNASGGKMLSWIILAIACVRREGLES